MTEATPDGRRLRLHVAEGIDDFLVDPLPAKRGKYLSNQFVRAAMYRYADQIGLEPLSPEEMERVFIEALGPRNYERMAGVLVDDATFSIVPELDVDDPDWRPTPDGEAMRSEEQQQLCLAAFYWQSVVGMPAVRELLGGDDGGPKALSLLLIGLGLALSPTLPDLELERQILSQADTPSTTTPTGTSATVRLPAGKRSVNQNPDKPKGQSKSRSK